MNIKEKVIVLGFPILLIGLSVIGTLNGIHEYGEMLKINEAQLNSMLENPNQQPKWAVDNTISKINYAKMNVVFSIVNPLNLLTLGLIVWILTVSIGEQKKTEQREYEI